MCLVEFDKSVKVQVRAVFCSFLLTIIITNVIILIYYTFCCRVRYMRFKVIHTILEILFWDQITRFKNAILSADKCRWTLTVNHLVRANLLGHNPWGRLCQTNTKHVYETDKTRLSNRFWNIVEKLVIFTRIYPTVHLIYTCASFRSFSKIRFRFLPPPPPSSASSSPIAE